MGVCRRILTLQPKLTRGAANWANSNLTNRRGGIITNLSAEVAEVCLKGDSLTGGLIESKAAVSDYNTLVTAARDCDSRVIRYGICVITGRKLQSSGGGAGDMALGIIGHRRNIERPTVRKCSCSSTFTNRTSSDAVTVVNGDSLSSTLVSGKVTTIRQARTSGNRDGSVVSYRPGAIYIVNDCCCRGNAGVVIVVREALSLSYNSRPCKVCYSKVREPSRRQSPRTNVVCIETQTTNNRANLSAERASNSLVAGITNEDVTVIEVGRIIRATGTANDNLPLRSIRPCYLTNILDSCGFSFGRGVGKTPKAGSARCGVNVESIAYRKRACVDCGHKAKASDSTVRVIVNSTTSQPDSWHLVSIISISRGYKDIVTTMTSNIYRNTLSNRATSRVANIKGNCCTLAYCARASVAKLTSASVVAQFVSVAGREGDCTSCTGISVVEVGAALRNIISSSRSSQLPGQSRLETVYVADNMVVAVVCYRGSDRNICRAIKRRRA